MPTDRAETLVLASASPRRAELLARLGVRARVVPAGVDETSVMTDPESLVLELAARKAAVVAGREPDAWVLGADTVVVLDGRVLGKPAGTAENEDFLRLLSGRWHEVITGVHLRGPGGERSVAERTRVRFRELSPAVVRGYAASGEGLDKAGGYGIQERGMALVARIEGDYFNVVGLPVARVLELADSLGVRLVPWVDDA